MRYVNTVSLKRPIYSEGMTPPDGWTQTLAAELGIELWRIPIVMLSATGIYLCFLVLVRIFGTRVLSRWNAFDAVVVIMFGSVAGRVIIGHPPTLAAGVIGLATLMLLEMVFGAMQSARGLQRFSTAPILLMVHGRFLSRNLRRTHLSHAEVQAALRQQGISSLQQVQCVILEPTGGLSIIRQGEELDPVLFDGVRGAERLNLQADRGRVSHETSAPRKDSGA